MILLLGRFADRASVVETAERAGTLDRFVENILGGLSTPSLAGTATATVEARTPLYQRVKNLACGFRSRGSLRMVVLVHPSRLDLMPKAYDSHEIRKPEKEHRLEEK